MTEHTGSRWDPHAAGWPPVGGSGLFPARYGAPYTPPPRPTYREPNPVRGLAFAAGLGAGVTWFLIFGLMGRDLRGYAAWTALAGLTAWLAALGLARNGDRGVAAGVACAGSLGWAILATVVALRWSAGGEWPLW